MTGQKMRRLRVLSKWSASRACPVADLAHSCRYHSVTLSDLPGKPAFVVPGCTLLHDALAEEKAADGGEATSKELEEMDAFEAENLPSNAYHALTRIVGSDILEEVFVLPKRLMPGVSLDSLQEEPEEANKADEEAAAATPAPKTPSRQRATSVGSDHRRSSRRKHVHPDRSNDRADFVPPEAKVTPARRKSVDADLSIASLEQEDEIQPVGRARKSRRATPKRSTSRARSPVEPEPAQTRRRSKRGDSSPDSPSHSSQPRRTRSSQKNA